MFTARYGLIPYIEQITFSLWKVKRITLAEGVRDYGYKEDILSSEECSNIWLEKNMQYLCSAPNVNELVKSRKILMYGEKGNAHKILFV